MIFYLSFADDVGFRGATFIEADGGEEALWAATKRNLNPGGEVAIVTVPDQLENEVRQYLNKFLTYEDAQKLGPELGNDEDLEDYDNVQVVCKNHNPVKGGRA